MKSTGVVRKIDELGRVVIPKSVREILDIPNESPLEIFIDEDRIVLQKYQPSCIFCDSVDNILFFNKKRVCEACLKKLKEMS